VFSLVGGDFDRLIEFEFAGCEVMAVDRLVCADPLVNVDAVDEAVAHLDVAEMCFSHGDLLGLTRNETAQEHRALTLPRKKIHGESFSNCQGFQDLALFCGCELVESVNNLRDLVGGFCPAV